MKYKKLLKKAAVSLLLAQSLIFTGLPLQAADIVGQSMVWTESAEMESAGDAVSAVSSDEMAVEESYVQDDFSAGDDQSGSGSTLDDDRQAGNGSAEGDASQAGNGSAEGDDSQAGNGSTEDDAGQSGNASFTGMTDGNPYQSEDLSDGFSDGGTDELQKQSSGFGSMDPDSAEEEKSEDNLTDEELEAQLEPIRELEPLSYVDPPAGNGNGDTGSVGVARAASYPAKYDPRSSLSIPVRNQKPSNMCWAYMAHWLPTWKSHFCRQVQVCLICQKNIWHISLPIEGTILLEIQPTTKTISSIPTEMEEIRLWLPFS